jgi:peptide/nickel transport system substrate-binding protein
MLSFVVIGAVAFGHAACGSSAASTPPASRAGEFRVLVPARPSTLNPDLYLDEIAFVIGRSLFNQLLALNESGRLLPELANAWTVSADGLTYTFTLREGVRWHDGVPFTSADVRWTLEKIAKEGFGGKDALAPVHSIVAPDAATVVITLKHPWAPFAADLAGAGLSILPRHVYADSDWRTHPANEAPVGTGPFKFGRWQTEHTLVLEANDDFFRSGPYVERLIFEVADPGASGEKLLRGEADYSVVRPASIEFASATPEPLSVHRLPSAGRTYVAMNLRRKPFDDARVRRALASAVDRLEVIEKGLNGLGAPAIGWYTPDVEWAYNAAARVPEYDVAQARALLNEAGLRERSGERFLARMVVVDTPPFPEIADVLRAQFRRIGVTLEVERMPAVDWAKRVVAARDFDLTMVSGGQGPDPDQLRRRFLAGTETGSYIGYDNPEFRAAVERGAGVVDLRARAAEYYRAMCPSFRSSRRSRSSFTTVACPVCRNSKRAAWWARSTSVW